MTYKRISFRKEKREYEDIKAYNKTFNFDSIQSYINSKDINSKYIQNPKEYFGHIFTNWYDFLQVDTTNFIQYKHEWIKFCKEKNVKSLEEYYNLCEIYEQLPKNPVEFYNNFISIGYELDWYNKRRYLNN